jgi:adenine-specific DNA-methyltransferase
MIPDRHLEDVFRGYLRHMVSIVVNPKGTGKLNFARVDEYAVFCVPDLGRSIIQGMPSTPSVVDETTAGEETDEEDEEDVEAQEEEEGDELD